MVRRNESIEYEKYKQDIIDYPEDFYQGLYKNIKWTIIRIDGHRNGYLHNLTEEEIDKIEPYVHGGITFKDDEKNIIGFDFSHGGDFFHGYMIDLYINNNYDVSLLEPLLNKPGTYKDYDWIINHIEYLIDKLY